MDLKAAKVEVYTTCSKRLLDLLERRMHGNIDDELPEDLAESANERADFVGHLLQEMLSIVGQSPGSVPQLIFPQKGAVRMRERSLLVVLKMPPV